MEYDLSARDKLPLSMKDIVFKELTSLVYKLKESNNAYYKVSFLTTAGTIVGNIAPCSAENEMIKYTDDPEKFTLDTSSIFDILSKQYNHDNDRKPGYSDAYMINVLDATIYEKGTRIEGIHADQIILFADQIVGFSLVRC